MAKPNEMTDQSGLVEPIPDSRGDDMAKPNEMTDQLGLVEPIPGKGFLAWFSRQQPAQDGFSLEVFRGNVHLGSILSNEISGDIKRRYDRLGIRGSDMILRINLGSRMMMISGQLPTGDRHFTCEYEMTLKLRVSHPDAFALHYHQQSDPIALAKAAIRGAIHKYAQRTPHNDINELDLCYQAETALELRSNLDIGVAVTSAYVTTLKPDPMYAEISNLTKQKTITDLEDTFAQAHETQTNIHRHGEEEEQNKHELRQDFIKAVAEETIRATISEIRSLREDDVPLEQILKKHMGTIDFLPISPKPEAKSLSPGPEMKRLNQGPTRNVKETGQPLFQQVSDTGSHPGTVSEQTNTIIHSTHMGVTLMPTTLSETQRRKLGLGVNSVFIVQMTDQDGPAERADLLPGDYLIEINDEPVQDAQSMTKIFEESVNEGNSCVTLRVLRGKQPLDLEVEIEKS